MDSQTSNQIYDREKDGKNILLCTVITYLIGIIAYGYVFINFVPAHDGMMVYTNDQYWMLQLGRFMVIQYVKLRGAMNSPWLIGMLAMLFISFAVFTCHKVLEIKFDIWKIIVVSSLFTLNIAYIATAATYIYLLDMFALTLFLCVLAVYINVHYSNVFSYVISAVIIGVAMGFYQSYITVVVGMYMIFAIKELMDGCSFSQVIKRGLLWIANILFGGISYYLLMKLSLAIYKIDLYHGTTNSVTNVEGLTIIRVIKLIPYSYLRLFQTLFSSNTYSSRIVDALNIVICILGLITLCFTCKNRCKGLCEKVLFIVLIVLFPFGVNSIYVAADGFLYHLMMFSYQLVLLLALYPALYEAIDVTTVIKKTKINYAKAVPGLLFSLVLINTFFITRFSNDLFYYKKLVGEGTTAAVTNIVYDIERNPAFDKKETPIVIIGNANESLASKYAMQYEVGNTAGVSTSGTTITYTDVLRWYMEKIFGKEYNFVRNQEIENEVSQNEKVKNMPEYPSEGYCEMVDGYMVIKFKQN